MKKTITLILILLACVAGFAFAEGTKIAQINAEPHESLIQYLSQLPGSLEAQLFYCIVIAGALGVFFNYAVKWMRKEIAGSLGTYLFVDNVRGTLFSWTSTIGAGAVGITAGMFETPDGAFIGWMRVLILCFVNGFFWDAVVNRGAKPTP